ncbi:reverse transcriptase family protein [Burkholderia cepacia]|uniref:reverse transcriptase family protein n=1 Tax=Burkholderia cepacia TaxID=292 RepID=UPI001626F059|nr:reverse transcriptase family protein [Burkholderia cepacia]
MATLWPADKFFIRENLDQNIKASFNVVGKAAPKMTANSEELLRLVGATYKSQKKISQYKNYINTLTNRGLPVIFSFRHLADVLGVAPATLHTMSFRTDLYYKRFDIPKRSGGIRKISAPHETLAAIQRWILENIISRAYQIISPSVVGYVKNKSIKDHVTVHAQSKQLVKFDLKDFFPSISVENVKHIFSEIGYSHSVSRTLAALVTLEGGLPQGASTSPAISNVFMQSFDNAMTTFCDEKCFLYTRYADDIVVSGESGVTESLFDLKAKFSEFGLTLNHGKTRVYADLQRVKFVTGLILCDGNVRLPKSMRRRIRVQCHLFLTQLERMTGLGPTEDNVSVPSSWRSRERVFDPTFPERVLGKLNYWLFIEPDNAYANRMKASILERLEAL